MVATALWSGGGGRETVSRLRRWSRMRLITPGSVMKPMTRISAPHRGHTSGSVSYTRRIRFAQRRLSAARSGGGGTGSSASPEPLPSSLSSAFRRRPRARFE